MGKIIETKIDRFDGGITNDPRDPAENTTRFVSNFDCITFPQKMSPYRHTESGDSSASTSQKQNFVIALRTGTTYSLYGLGVVSGTSRAEFLYKNLTNTGTTDFGDATWTNTSNYQAGSGTINLNLCVFYRRDGHIFFGDANAIGRYDPDGGDAIDPAFQALTYTYITQGIVHSKDDRLYIGYYSNGGAAGAKSFIMSKNGAAAFSTTALTLPDDLVPTSICEFGNFLAIGLAAANGVGNSRIFLWDRNEATTTLAETIDAGSGSLIIMEQVDGELIWISQKGGVQASFSGIPNLETPHTDKVYFRRLSGNVGVKFFELHSDRAGGVNTTEIPLHKQKIDNRLFFQMAIVFSGSLRHGVWSIGRSSPQSPFVLVQEQKTNNNTTLLGGDTLDGFIKVGDFLLQGYTTSGTYAVSKTVLLTNNDFSENSIYESKPFDGRIHGFDNTFYKDLTEVAVTTEPMLTAGQIVLAYQTDEDIGTSTWTTIFTNTTNNSISHVANNIESSGAALPKMYKEISFRILSTGRAEVTGLRFKEDVTGQRFVTD